MFNSLLNQNLALMTNLNKLETGYGYLNFSCFYPMWD